MSFLYALLFRLINLKGVNRGVDKAETGLEDLPDVCWELARSLFLFISSISEKSASLNISIFWGGSLLMFWDFSFKAGLFLGRGPERKSLGSLNSVEVLRLKEGLVALGLYLIFSDIRSWEEIVGAWRRELTLERLFFLGVFSSNEVLAF